MLASGIPSKFPIVWGASAVYINPIPTTSQIGINNGYASLPDGFVPLNQTPVGAGGVPPRIQDMNGALNELFAWSQWYQAGGPITYDGAFQTAVGGYPLGSVVQSATTPGKFWRSTANSNTTNPDAAGAGWVDASAKTQTVFLAGASGTYTPPTGCVSLSVRMIGGGGGGEHSHSLSFPVTVSATAGGNTTFGSFTAGGGKSGGTGSGTGGGTPASGGSTSGGSVNIQPSPASSAPNGGLPSATWSAGSAGGSTPLGFGGNGTGTAGTGYGAGGGGGYIQTTAGQVGLGGYGGGYLEALISSVAGSYSYSVGNAGAGTTGGIQPSSNATGGIIIIDEGY